MHSKLLNTFKALMLGLALSIPSVGWSATVSETPSALAMTSDAIFVRPAMMVTTIIGAGVFIISSPFAALGNNIDDTWETLVEGPFETTFIRCLGCTTSGRKVSEVVEQED